MAPVDPVVFLRIGSHAEKDYFRKTLRFFDGLVVAANLIEATPAATSSFVLSMCGENGHISYYVDPMTHAYGTDPDWIRSDQKRGGVVSRDYKRAYRRLAEQLGPPFSDAVEDIRAVTPVDFLDREDTVCRSVVTYQLQRIRSEFEADPEFARFSDAVPQPAAVFAPYFYIPHTEPGPWTQLCLRASSATAHLGLDLPVHAVVCADVGCLRETTWIDTLPQGLPQTGVDGVWFWFTGFSEYDAATETLRVFRDLVATLSESMEVYNMRGGYFSLALSRYGLRGISHGVGYGESKDIVPVMGQSVPTVRYYLPALHKRLGVPEIERCFDAMGVRTAQEFHATICGCAVCRGVVSEHVSQFEAFGEKHFARQDSTRKTQTAAAAKRCRFHFLLNRVSERNNVRGASADEIAADLRRAHETFADKPSIRTADKNQVLNWAAALT